MGLAEKYCSEIFDNVRYHATWLPNMPMKLGDFGRFDDDIFHKFGNICDFNIQFSAELGVPTTNQEWLSTGASMTHFGIGVGGFINAGLQFTFERKYAMYLLAANCQLSLMNNLITVKGQVETLFKQKGFDDMHLVTEILSAESSSVVISQEKKAEFAIEAKDNKIPKIDLTIANVGFDVKKNSKIGHSTVAKQGLTPLFQTVELDD